VEQRYGIALQRVEQARHKVRESKNGSDSVDAVVDELVSRYSKELAAVAAVTGGAAAVPGAGTATAIATLGADMAYSVTKLGEMIMAIGIAYGHDADSFERRKAWVLTVLSMGRGAVVGVDGIAGKIGAQGGAHLVSTLGRTQLDTVNSKLAAKIATVLASEQVAARLGRVLPFGIGAGVGAAGNVVIVRSMAKSARKFFGAPADSGLSPYNNSIETTARESGGPVASKPSDPHRR
jgi:hypothetical protein